MDILHHDMNSKYMLYLRIISENIYMTVNFEIVII